MQKNKHERKHTHFELDTKIKQKKEDKKKSLSTSLPAAGDLLRRDWMLVLGEKRFREPDIFPQVPDFIIRHSASRQIQLFTDGLDGII